MAKDDYYVIVYRILSYLYACLKSGVKPQEDDISPQTLKIEPSYWIYIIENLQNSGFINGVYVGKLLGGTPTVKMQDIQITPDGISYLQGNSSMQKALEFLKSLKEIIPGI